MSCYCCEDMAKKVLDCCNEDKKSDDENLVVYYFSNVREYGIPVRNGEVGYSSYIMIEYCPWCGKKLPESKRVEWFEALEKLGYDSPFEQDIPDSFKCSDWYES